MTLQPDSELAQAATRIARRLQEAGFQAFWVGGSVRDLLLGREPGDYDIATSALTDQVESLFPKTIPVGKKFGVVIVREPPFEFQVATFRAESDYRDGRRPEEVQFGDPRADALRRDFTVNGLFYDPVAGELRDWVGGGPDLKAQILRTIGNPDERFGEDYLRMLRAVRLAARLGFAIEEGTMASVQRNAQLITRTSPERIRDELIKLLRPPHAARGLELLRESGLIGHVLPEIAATITCEQSPDFHPEGSVFNHIKLMLQHLPADADPSLPWAALLHDVAKPLTASRDPLTGTIHFYTHERVGAEMTEVILTRLRFPRRQIDEIVTAVRGHMRFKDAPQMRQSTLRRMLLEPTFPLELQLHRLDCLGSHGRLGIYDYLIEQKLQMDQQPALLPPLVTGRDLMDQGVAPGPEMGRLLSRIRDLQLQEELHTSEQALAWLRKELGSGPR